MTTATRAALWALWPMIEYLLNKSLDLLEWLLAEHEDWFDRLVTPWIEHAVEKGYL